MTIKRALAALATTALMVTPVVAQAEASQAPAAAKLSVAFAAETAGLRAGAKGKRSKLAQGAVIGIVVGAAAVTAATVAIADDDDEPSSPS